MVRSELTTSKSERSFGSKSERPVSTPNAAVGSNKAFLEMLAKQNTQILASLKTQNELLQKLVISGKTVAAKETELDSLSDAVPAMVGSEEEPLSTTMGPWSFTESDHAFRFRQRVMKTNNPNMGSNHLIKPLSREELADGGDALFGNVCGDEQLTGDSFGKNWKNMKNMVNGKPAAPRWSKDCKNSIRDLLPQIEIDGVKGIKRNTGIYYLTVQYNNQEDMWGVEAGVIIGEIGFGNRGQALAKNCPLDQIERGEYEGVIRGATWYSTQVSTSAWEDGNKIRFKIDTDTDTLWYWDESSGKKKVFPGAFRHTLEPDEDIQIFAYCGAKFMKDFPNSHYSNNQLSIIRKKKPW